MAGFAYFSAGEKLTNATARHRFTTQAHLGIYKDLKSKFFPKLLKLLAVSFGAMPKMEVRALMHFFRPQSSTDDLFCEIARRGCRELLIESNYECCIDSRFL